MKRKTLGMWEHLKATGALDKGDDAIEAAKKEWRKIYNTRYKAERRKTISLHVVSLRPDERRMMAMCAKQHNASVTPFIKKAAIAYAEGIYLVHDSATIRKIEAVLVRSLSALEDISRGEKKKGWLGKVSDASDAKKVVTSLRTEVMRELAKPDLLITAIKNNPNRWQDILNVIHDSKDDRR
ncbi:MAG: hypothetical protein JSS76_04550 [Bacteroidetes bacterium]|nr:hypothetical protein [Bacteroidota bacterium]